MKKTFQLLIFSLFSVCALKAQFNVTFRVDMTGKTVSSNGVYVAGSFQGWNPAGTPLTNQGNGIWSVTVANVQAGNIDYKFLNGNSWGTDETVPSACATNNNRTANITASQTLPAVCFGECNPCATNQTFNVTFQVDMTGQSVSPNGVHVAGSFQGWNPAGTPLTNLGNGKWSVTVPNVPSGTIQYKFVNGNAWGSDEGVPGSCNTGGNRTASITANTTIPEVCYGQCNACPTQNYSATFQVDMTGQTVSPNGVHIAGNFQSWNPSGTPLTNQGNGIWAVTVPNIGGNIEYKFINGNAWGSDESVPGTCATNGNRSANITANTTFPVVCFAQCAACPTQTYSATFSVDMSLQTVSPNGVYIAGRFQGWNAGATPMTNQGNGIWSITVPNLFGNIEYKFINGNTWGNDESVPGTCATSGNRSANITANTTVPTVCFAQCAACPTQTYSATFSVDMTSQTVSPNGVHIAGNFQGWNAGATPMTNQGNGIWSITVPNLFGNVEYKFINGNAWGSDETINGTCNSNGNRVVGISANTTVPTVCFGECGVCDNIINAKIYLSGVDAATNLISDALKASTNFPLNDPYVYPPYNSTFIHVNNTDTAKTTAAVLAVSGNNSIVDWVFLTLETEINNIVTPIYTKTALIQADGDIVSSNGTSPVRFAGALAGNYYLKIGHRNHLNHRTLNKIAIGTTPLTINLTNNSIASFGPTAVVSANVRAMIGGDANYDGSIDAFDTIIWENQNGLFSDYTLNSDYNADGSCDAFDSIIWELNNGLFYP